MRKLWMLSTGLLLVACTSKSPDNNTGSPMAAGKDTLSYAYKATYSSDISVPGNQEYAQKVLLVWKAFEMNQITAKRSFFADTITYNDAGGMHFYGPADSLLAFAQRETNGLDSLRFDISSWTSSHVNDKNEDWVNIWSTERSYPKKGGHADTILMQENWKVKDGKIVYFDQYTSKLPK